MSYITVSRKRLHKLWMSDHPTSTDTVCTRGQKFEQIACEIYENWNKKQEMTPDDEPFISASPINITYTDSKPHMIEIKCEFSEKN